MEKIDLNKIRGKYIEYGEVGTKWENVCIAGGDDTIESIKMVADKVNEIIEYLSPQSGDELSKED